MNKTAIELIQQTAIDANARRLPDVLGNKAIALPENYNLHYLEKILRTPLPLSWRTGNKIHCRLRAVRQNQGQK